ncbi:transcription initiation factor TFIID subunit 12 isoform X2 [Pseudomyrmex gracilis]|uniref:transcription initiation factor TFIID subunit 12 isoform X2 n=1 Tax=Pseudomyrmex gracilis TaxID=219809 RepID=UPI0009950123|nr:transcription initiation factor TFIID subunit 12 isoform X2 [Pseudomyrmex gracilis]XP_020283071.1 transcription initiation factor TFIID subunit 12 isoform X2 [Pseudomyrmex gracilis]XP_020283072.1 transcription initiation factor TFIID subunit 12 isoform X2 [Pseudomyrmex gracilis]XP_020283073.1 transcription initiation factor TFIID subunit 12 isoform X2 [Pseudomyrmex gracilis]
MSQQSATVQTTTTGTDITPAVLGTLQSVGPSSQAPALSNIQSNSTTTTTIQTQSQQTQYISQPAPKQVQQSSTPNFSDFPQFLTKTRLQDLVREVDPTEQLDEEVEELLLQLADDFVETTVNAACQLAKHRRANTVEVKDVQLHLERNWNMWIPGFGTDEVRPYKRATVTEAHKQRLALIRKSIKKY